MKKIRPVDAADKIKTSFDMSNNANIRNDIMNKAVKSSDIIHRVIRLVGATDNRARDSRSNFSG